MIEDFARVLREKLLEEANSEKDSICRGSVKDYADYKYGCGVIRGLELADQLIRDLLTAVRKADDL